MLCSIIAYYNASIDVCYIDSDKQVGRKEKDMERYNYSCTVNGECVGYLESTTEEDKLDMVDDQMAVRFTGNGYLAFWKRCKEFERSVQGEDRRSVILDTYTGEEKVW